MYAGRCVVRPSWSIFPRAGNTHRVAASSAGYIYIYIYISLYIYIYTHT